MKGKLIVIEGMPGSGVKTQAKLLSKKMGCEWHDWLDMGLDYPESLDFFKSALELAYSKIVQDRNFILARYDISLFVLAEARGYIPERIQEIWNEKMGRVKIQPDVAFFLRSDPIVAMKRFAEACRNRENLLFYTRKTRKMYDSYLDWVTAWNHWADLTGDKPLVIMDAQAGTLQISAQIERKVFPRLE